MNGVCGQMCIDLQSNILLIPHTASPLDTSGAVLLPLPKAVLTSSRHLTHLFLHMTHLQDLCCIIKKKKKGGIKGVKSEDHVTAVLE